MMKALVWASPAINTILKPFGLILWIDYECDEDENGLPLNLRIAGASIGRRPRILFPDEH